ncbi:MAG: hypothetical protein EXS08_15975 [Planctomycetes bacterium]|nr:hypothetical protein [Planctomycetota bacterium]
MTAADQAALQKAAELHRGLARAAGLARTNAYGYVIFGVLSLLVAVLGLDLLGLAIGALLTGVGVAQLRAAPRLQRGEAAAPRALARNELVLMGGIVVYCLLQLTVLRTTSAELEKQVGAAGDLGLDLGELVDSMTTLIYCSFLVVSLVYQGGLALYFNRRGPLAARYLAESPAWARTAVESLRA